MRTKFSGHCGTAFDSRLMGDQMAGMKTATVSLLIIFGLIPAPSLPASRVAYSIDPQQSKIEIQVAKDGFLKAFGHDHLVSATQYSGEVQFDSAKVEESSVVFTVEAASLKV